MAEVGERSTDFGRDAAGEADAFTGEAGGDMVLGVSFGAGAGEGRSDGRIKVKERDRGRLVK